MKKKLSTKWNMFKDKWPNVNSNIIAMTTMGDVFSGRYAFKYDINQNVLFIGDYPNESFIFKTDFIKSSGELEYWLDFCIFHSISETFSGCKLNKIINDCCMFENPSYKLFCCDNISEYGCSTSRHNLIKIITEFDNLYDKEFFFDYKNRFNNFIDKKIPSEFTRVKEELYAQFRRCQVKESKKLE